MRFVALTAAGRYLRVAIADGDDRPRLCASGESVDAGATFERIDLSHGRVALRTLDGRYLTVAPDRGQNFGIYQGDELVPAAAFEEILWPDGRVSLRSCELCYLSVGAGGAPPGAGAGVDPSEPGCAVTANRVEAGPAERFCYVDVPLAMVPPQRRPSEHESSSPGVDARSR